MNKAHACRHRIRQTGSWLLESERWAPSGAAKVRPRTFLTANGANDDGGGGGENGGTASLTLSLSLSLSPLVVGIV
jgi:hypothetical protein